ncbi:MAG: hypothetical protein GY853_00585, partial [PVC group bacterium]|nr:hypothetical protein [PVC group bacterium]
LKNENGKLIGRLIKLNENKYVKFFCDSNDVWISEIKRNSNFQFSLKEKKIGNELFSIYGLETSKEYKVEFIDENTFGLISNNEDPLKSKIKYRRIE